MADTLIRLATGCGFFLLGRWAYGNVRTIYPRAFYSNPESPVLLMPVRVLAFLLMLGGCYTLLMLAVERTSGGLIGVFAALAASFCAAWFLRPKLPHPAAPTERPKPAIGLTGKGKWFVGLVLVAAVAILVATLAYLHR